MGRAEVSARPVATQHRLPSLERFHMLGCGSIFGIGPFERS